MNLIFFNVSYQFFLFFITSNHLMFYLFTEGESEGQTNETALRHFEEFSKIKETVNELHEKVETEAGSITQDQKYYADYLCGVKNFKPWMDEAEAVAKTKLVKPVSLDETKKLLEEVKVSILHTN